MPVRQRYFISRSCSEARAGGRPRYLRSLRIATVGVVVLAVLGVGITASQDDERTEGSASARVHELVAGEAEESAPPEAREIPAVKPSEQASPVSEPSLELEEMRSAAPSEEIDAASGEEPASAAAEPMVVAVEDVPQGDGTTLQAGGATATVATVSGTGSVDLGFTRTSSSSAPNLPTYVSTICDGASVYSGAFNTTTQGPVVQDVPYSGTNCVIKVRVAQPSDRWTGTSSSVVVTHDEPDSQSGTPYVEQAEWTTTAVDGEDSFTIDVPAGFTGTVSLKLTACSSQGGTSDQTRKHACGDLVQKGIGSEGSFTVSDGQQVLAETGFDITAETHHDMVTVDVEEPAADDLTISVEQTDGSAVLVHGPGTSVVGTH